MFKIKKTVGICGFILITFALPAFADVYIDTSRTEEIKITNCSLDLLDLNNPITIKEPIDQSREKEISLANTYVPTEPVGVNNSQYAKLPFNKEVMAAAKETTLNPALIHAVIATESKHNPYAKSHKGAVGLMQLMPATASKFNVKNKQDPKQNILAGSRYLRELLTQFNGDLTLSLAAYNAGPGAVIKYQHNIPPYKETRDYVPKVLNYYRQYSQYFIDYLL